MSDETTKIPDLSNVPMHPAPSDRWVALFRCKWCGAQFERPVHMISLMSMECENYLRAETIIVEVQPERGHLAHHVSPRAMHDCGETPENMRPVGAPPYKDHLGHGEFLAVRRLEE